MASTDGVEVSTDGIALRAPSDADAGAVVAAVRRSLDDLAVWMPWATDRYGEADALAWIRGELGDAHRFVIVEQDSGEILGSCGLNQVDEENHSANLGYWVRSDRTGHGVATTAARLLADFGLGPAGYHRLCIVMSLDNPASRRVAEKAGALHEGVARGRLLLRGRYHDAHVYSIVSGAETADTRCRRR